MQDTTKTILEVEVEYLSKCDIRQAAEWIAFNLKPTTPLSEGLPQYAAVYNSKDYEKRASNALMQLRIALFNGLITATGERDGERCNIPTTTAQQIDFLIAPDYVIPGNSILLDDNTEFALIYENVEFDVESLTKAFPVIKTYKSIYQIIMEETVVEEGITEEKQGNKESLKMVVEAKMKKYGVPESDVLCDKMVTLIRNPESQKGMGRKDHPNRIENRKKQK